MRPDVTDLKHLYSRNVEIPYVLSKSDSQCDREQLGDLENLTFNEFAFQEAFIASIRRWNNILGRLDLDCSAVSQ